MPIPALAIQALASFAPAMLSKLFGNDPQKKLQKQLLQLMSPQALAALTNQFYQQGLASPAFSQAQGAIAQGANATQGQLSSALGARGIGTSGTGALMSSIVPSIVGQQQAGLRTATYQGAQNQAQNSLQQQIQALLGTSGPSQTQQLFGTGLEAFSPFLTDWLKGLGNRLPTQSLNWAANYSPPIPAPRQ
jgi:hypothetical protein